MDHPEEVTLTMRVEDMPGPVPGSGKDSCEGCGSDVWVSPATRQEIQRGLYPEYILCMRCAGEE